MCRIHNTAICVENVKFDEKCTYEVWWLQRHLAPTKLVNPGSPGQERESITCACQQLTTTATNRKTWRWYPGCWTASRRVRTASSLLIRSKLVPFTSRIMSPGSMRPSNATAPLQNNFPSTTQFQSCWYCLLINGQRSHYYYYYYRCRDYGDDVTVNRCRGTVQN